MNNKDISVFLLCLLILLFVLNYVFKFSGIGNKTFESFETDNCPAIKVVTDKNLRKIITKAKGNKWKTELYYLRNILKKTF